MSLDMTAPRLRLAVAQLNFTIGAFEGNVGLIEHAVQKAKERKVQVLVLTELATCGYPPRDLLEHPGFIDASQQALNRVARLSDDKLAIVCGFPDRASPASTKPLHNAVAVCHKGRILRRIYKTLLPTYDAFDESRYFEPAPPDTLKIVRLFGVKLGITIGEDIWPDDRLLPGRHQREDPVETLMKQGAEVLINVAAIPFELGASAQRRIQAGELAGRHKVPVVFAHQAGGNDGLIFDGHSRIINADGYAAARARDFGEDFVVVDLDRQDRFWRVGGAEEPNNAANALDEVHRALVLGTRDYLYKTGHRSAVLELTGGIEAALTATIAAEALGPEQVTGVAMIAPRTPLDVLDDARSLAENLGIHFQAVNIEPALQAAATPLLSQANGHLTVRTEENIAARVRAMVLMGLADTLGAMVLTCVNKTDLAVGRCTLYGDLCGGLGVLSDLPASLVVRLSRHLNHIQALVDLTPPIPKDILSRPASGRPHTGLLTPQELLPDDSIIDRILELHIGELRPADQISRSEGYELQMVRHIISALHRSEYKRRQAPPSLQIASSAFAVGSRFPIVSRSPDAGT